MTKKKDLLPIELKAAKCLRGYTNNEEIDDFDREFTIETNCSRCQLKYFCFEEIKKRLKIEKKEE